MLDGGDHEIADVLGRDAAGGGDVPHGFTITAVEREGDADLFAVVASDLQRVRAPAGIASVNRDATVVPAFLALAAMALKEQPMRFHHAIDALGIGRCASRARRLAAQQGMHPPIPVGRQIGDERAYVGDQLVIGQRRPSSSSCGRLVPCGRQMLPADAHRVGNRGH